MKPLPTYYKGFTFRSALEARYAVFFDILGEPWLYENDGFDLDDGDRYRPDFWLPERDTYLEVKGKYPDTREIRVARKVQFFTGCDVLISHGMPGENDILKFGRSDENGGELTETFIDWPWPNGGKIHAATLAAKQVRFAWYHMHRRCESPKDNGFKNYGGRGITVCERWNSLELFYADMGDPPTPKHTLERIDNEKGYSPDNCKWATRAEQNNNTRSNRRLTLHGKTQTVVQWADELGIPRDCIFSRLRRGLSDADALQLSHYLNGPKEPLRGEAIGSAKLTDDKVRQIRSYRNSGSSQLEVAKMFGIAQSIVSQIQTGKRWKHVQ